MSDEKKASQIPEEVKIDPAQTDPPTPIIMGQEPIPNPDITRDKKEKK